MYLQQSKHCIINQQSKHYNVSWINKQARGKDRLKRSSCNAQGKKWLIVLPVTRQLLGKEGGEGACGRKNRKENGIFFLFPLKTGVSLCYSQDRSILTDCGKVISMLWPKVFIHLVNFMQRYDLVYFVLKFWWKKQVRCLFSLWS